MSDLVLVTTGDGVVVCERDGNAWRERAHRLSGHAVTCITACADAIFAGMHDGIVRSSDQGQTWRDANAGLMTRYVRWLAADAQVILAGTEPAAIFVSRDAGATWRECPEIAQLRDAHGWMLPYSPRAGCIRGFALQGAHAYAAVEVGGVLRSDDRGQTWRLVEGSDGKPTFGNPRENYIHPDVHSINTHPTSPDLVFAPTGGGFYTSRDGGKLWTLLYDCYCRAVWVDPGDPAHLILGPARGVDSGGRIEESRDAGATWRAASRGLDVPWKKHMVERFVQVADELFAVLSNGELLAAPLATLEWRRVLPNIKDIRAIAQV